MKYRTFERTYHNAFSDMGSWGSGFSKSGVLLGSLLGVLAMRCIC